MLKWWIEYWIWETEKSVWCRFSWEARQSTGMDGWFSLQSTKWTTGLKSSPFWQLRPLVSRRLEEIKSRVRSSKAIMVYAICSNTSQLFKNQCSSFEQHWLKFPSFDISAWNFKISWMLKLLFQIKDLLPLLTLFLSRVAISSVKMEEA